MIKYTWNSYEHVLAYVAVARNIAGRYFLIIVNWCALADLENLQNRVIMELVSIGGRRTRLQPARSWKGVDGVKGSLLFGAVEMTRYEKEARIRSK